MPELGPYHRRLPIGERLSVDALVGDQLFPFEGEIRLRPLEPPLDPEPERRGLAAEECGCTQSDGVGVVWEDERWRVLVDEQPHALPMVAVLMPRAHHDLDDLPAELAAELGPIIQRVARAIGGFEEVGRVHVNRWGDGSFHFHVWFLARPLGMWQMRGAMLPIWDDLLPKQPVEEWQAGRHRLAEGLAVGGGVALI